MTRENPSLGNFCVCCQTVVDPSSNMARGCDGELLPVCISCWERMPEDRRFELAIFYYNQPSAYSRDDFDDDDEDEDPYGLFSDHPERN